MLLYPLFQPYGRNTSQKDICPSPVVFIFYLTVLVFLHWQLDLAEGKNGINFSGFFALYLELCWAHKSCCVSSHHHNLPGKDSIIAP